MIDMQAGVEHDFINFFNNKASISMSSQGTLSSDAHHRHACAFWCLFRCGI
jgi:hypothetical protein